VGLLEEGDAMLEFVKQFRIPGDVVKRPGPSTMI
jgi:hypothetical protein